MQLGKCHNPEAPPIASPPTSSSATMPLLDHPTPTHHQTFRLHSLNSTILIRQFPTQGISFQLWPAATTLLTLLDRHAASHPTNTTPLSSSFNICGRRRPRILELGSGTGVVGIAAAALLGASVTVTDLPHVLPNLQFNVDANTAILEVHGGAVDVAALSWGESKDMEAIGREYDLIIGSDLVYHDNLYEALLETLKFLLVGTGRRSEKKMVFVMGHLKRWKKESAFFKKAKKLFDVEVVYNDAPFDGSRIGVTVYQFVDYGNHTQSDMLRMTYDDGVIEYWDNTWDGIKLMIIEDQVCRSLLYPFRWFVCLRQREPKFICQEFTLRNLENKMLAQET